MAKKHSKQKRTDKPAKPRPDYPLFAHDSGRWSKKVRNRLAYFGRWGHRENGKVVPVEDVAASAEEAEQLYILQRDDLYAGRRPRVQSVDTPEGVNVRIALNAFLKAKMDMVESGEIKQRTYNDLKRTCDHLVTVFGKHRLIDNLGPRDFATLKRYFAKGRGPTALSNEVRRTRSIFKWITEYFDDELAKQPKFGPDFRQAKASEVRKIRQEMGKLVYSAEEVSALLGECGTQLRAMVYLAINAGLGQNDCSELRISHIDFDAGVLDYTRPKTGIERRTILWPETVKAIKAALAERPATMGGTPKDLVFVTRHGNRWVRHYAQGVRDSDKIGSGVDAVTMQFNKAQSDLGMKRKRRSFYSLRRTLQTIGDETLDHQAVARIMGHHDPSMGGRYNQGIDDKRLRKVCWHVRKWLRAGQ